MNYDSEAIRKAYPNAVVIHDDVGVFEQVALTKMMMQY